MVVLFAHACQTSKGIRKLAANQNAYLTLIVQLIKLALIGIVEIHVV